MYDRYRFNGIDEDIGPAHLEYAGWEALQRIVPGYGRMPAAMEAADIKAYLDKTCPRVPTTVKQENRHVFLYCGGA